MNNSGTAIFEADEENFDEAVMARSREVPVMVDFWAEWCAPCRQLAPVLEKTVRKFQNKIVLAKVNVDRNAELAAFFGIRSIPAVKIFRDGKVVKEFVGALPAGEVRKIVEEIIPAGGARDAEIEKANRCLSGGRWEEAATIYSRILQSDPANPAAHLGLGVITFHQARWEEAENHLNRVGGATPGSEQVPGLLARVYFEKLQPPDLEEATRKMKENPEDPEALFALAIAYAKGNEYERALDTLLRVIRTDKNFSGGAPREAYLRLLDILGRNSESGRKYDRMLSMTLFA